MGFITDGLTNVLAQIGMGGDKAAHSQYSPHFTDRQELLNAYLYAWLPGKIVDLPAQDATREWRKWQGDTDAVEAVEAVEKRIHLQRRVKEALITARLFGASAILIHTDRTTLTAPLQPDEKIRSLEVIDLGASNGGLLSRFPATGRRIRRKQSDIVDLGQGDKAHRSRMCFFNGNYVPGSEQGDSVINRAYDAVVNADAVAANVAALVFESKIDVFKIPNLMNNLGSQEYESSLMNRLQIANHGKSITNSLLMDAEEDYEQKSVNFGSLNEIMLTSYQIAAGAAGIPATKLLGLSPSGLNATGDNEVRDYYDTVRSEQTNEIGPALVNLDALIMQNAGVPEMDYEWVSLWQETSSERSENVNKLSAAVGSLAQTALFPDEVLGDAAAQILGGYMPALEVEDND